MGGWSWEFVNDVVEAIPEPASFYAFDSDSLISNSLWKSQLGDSTRLADSAELPPDLQELARLLPALPTDATKPLPVPLDEDGMRTFVCSRVGNEPPLALIVFRDQSEERRVDQMRKDFIANVSHELRTPLTAVRGYVETLLDPKFLTMDRVQQFLPIIFEHSERLHNLMLDLLSLSRLESSDTVIELMPMALCDELQEAVEATAPLARLKNITVVLNPPTTPVHVLANPEHLERVLVNLLDNAIKYSAADDKIVISTERDGEYIWVHIVDEGQGIPPEELPRVFERFYRTKGALSGRSRGTGLGLAIVKHIISQLGGEVKVSSVLGSGSDFYFSLKLTPGH